MRHRVGSFPEMSNKSKKLLAEIRARRGFDPASYLAQKVVALNSYFSEHKIEQAVIAVSGGVDSALVLELLKRTTVKVLPLTLPCYGTSGVTGQAESARASIMQGAKMLELSSLLEEFERKIDSALTSEVPKSTPWSVGQTVPYMRTALLYSLISRLSTVTKTVLVGTTNRDEGSYLGYFGKASDGLVDIQPISDLHKSEVFQLARFLGVNPEIIARVPTGDMFDRAPDEQVFGAPYDFVELYTSSHLTAAELDAVRVVDAALCANLDSLHLANEHKYLGASPAVHLDILQTSTLLQDQLMVNKRPRERWCLPEGTYVLPAFTPSRHGVYDFTSADVPSGLTSFSKVGHLRGALSEAELLQLEDAAVSGVSSGMTFTTDLHGRPTIMSSAAGGSTRTRFYSPKVAEEIFEQCKFYIKHVLAVNNLEDQPIGLNPLFRALKYNQAQQLLPHYDESREMGFKKSTALTMLIFLTPGSTQFFRETRLNHQHRDLDNMPTKAAASVQARRGDILVFPHRLLHGSFCGQEKHVIRTDVIVKG